MSDQACQVDSTDGNPQAETMSMKHKFQRLITAFTAFYWIYTLYTGCFSDDVKGWMVLQNMPLVLTGLFLGIMSLTALFSNKALLFFVLFAGFIAVGVVL